MFRLCKLFDSSCGSISSLLLCRVYDTHKASVFDLIRLKACETVVRNDYSLLMVQSLEVYKTKSWNDVSRSRTEFSVILFVILTSFDLISVTTFSCHIRNLCGRSRIIFQI